MKIGIISINMYSKGLNFACPLHTWAFQQFLKKNGIESVILDYKPNYYQNFDLRHPYTYYKEKYQEKLEKADYSRDPKTEELYQENLAYIKEKMEQWAPLVKEWEIRCDKFQSFIDRNYIRTPKCYDELLLETEDPGFDCYICATDVIWKNTPDFGYDRGFFLACTCMENKKRSPMLPAGAPILPKRRRKKRSSFII